MKRRMLLDEQMVRFFSLAEKLATFSRSMEVERFMAPTEEGP